MTTPRRVAITGAGGQLGRQLVAAFGERGAEVLALARPDFEITRAADLAAITDWGPDLVVNAAAWTDVDGCARDPERAMRINGEGAGEVAAAAARAGAAMIQISTNEVFDGTLDRAYEEADIPNPINPYGASKLAGERAVAAANPQHLIVRTAWLFGPGGTNFVTKILAAADRAVAGATPLALVTDEWGNPTWTPDLAAATASISGDAAWGRVVHLAGEPAASRLEWARAALHAAASRAEVVPTTRAAFARLSPVRGRAVLRPSAGTPPLTWADQTRDYARSLARDGRDPALPA